MEPRTSALMVRFTFIYLNRVINFCCTIFVVNFTFVHFAFVRFGLVESLVCVRDLLYSLFVLVQLFQFASFN